jgi:DNA-binding transcriptional regulator YdaS (Cro superfamily)
LSDHIEPQIDSGEQKPTIFDHGSDDKLTKELGKIFDKSEGKIEALHEAKDVPSAKTDSFDQAFESTWDHLHASPQERATVQDAHKLVETVRANAKKFGVELTDQQAMEAAWKLEQEQATAPSNEYAQAEEAIRQHYPNEKPADIARAYADMETRLRQNPVAGVAKIANRLGIHPMQLAQQIALQYSGQAQPSAADEAAVRGIVEQVYAQNPRMEELQDDVYEALKSSKLTGDHATDLRRAYAKAVAKDKKRSSADRMGRTMEQVYARASGAKR